VPTTVAIGQVGDVVDGPANGRVIHCRGGEGRGGGGAAVLPPPRVWSQPGRGLGVVPWSAFWTTEHELDVAGAGPLPDVILEQVARRLRGCTTSAATPRERQPPAGLRRPMETFLDSGPPTPAWRRPDVHGSVTQSHGRTCPGDVPSDRTSGTSVTDLAV
jgi:hypothetical protein